MNEEKRNRITAAVTINAILLVFIIVAVLIAQIVQISVLTRRKNQLLSEYQQVVAQLEHAEQVRDTLGTEDGEILLEILKLSEDKQAILEQLLQIGVQP